MLVDSTFSTMSTFTKWSATSIREGYAYKTKKQSEYVSNSGHISMVGYIKNFQISFYLLRT
jgi:hypothetical protein